MRINGRIFNYDDDSNSLGVLMFCEVLSTQTFYKKAFIIYIVGV